MLMAFWLASPSVIGMVWAKNFSERWPAAVAKTALMLVLCGAILLATFTGYLRPSPAEPGFGAEESRNRFLILHMIALPVAIAGLLGGWLWLLRNPVQPPEPPTR